MSAKGLDGFGDGTSASYLIICDRVSQVLDEAIQDAGVVSVL